ncbi:MAG: diaminopimelate epimerase [Dehalococcoidales bacterium]|nr:diaminopimelate epimerase [Dehalococcoidales bacterium]
MNFTKMQAAGNDFILVETSDINRDWSQIAIAICDRHFGVGADGLLLVLPSDTANFQMRVFNPDGSEAKACGNGLRCLAKYVVDKGLANTGAQEILVETMSGIRRVKLYKAGGEVIRIQAGMGKPKFGAKDIPIAIEQGSSNEVDIKPILNYSVTIEGRELLLNFVSIGNPHVVYFWQHSVSDFPLSQLGPRVERHELFPNRVNFEVAQVISRHQIEARVWERGVGETLACGTGACAIAVVAQLHGYIDNKVDIKLPGGILNVEWDGVGEVFLSGPAEIVFTGDWPTEDCLSRVD